MCLKEILTARVHICYWASEGHLNKVKEKLDAGANIDSRDADKRTPLMWCADRGHTGIHKDENRGTTETRNETRDERNYKYRRRETNK